jgi:hypothetical protein
MTLLWATGVACCMMMIVLSTLPSRASADVLPAERRPNIVFIL